MKTIITALIFIILTVFNLPAERSFDFISNLDFAQIEFVKAVQNSNNSWTFYVTVRHNDEGWNHYADLWVITDPESGNILGERVLAHPHLNEQPFARSLSGVVLPEGQRFLEFSAKCTRHGYEGQRIFVDLEMEAGEGYMVRINWIKH